MIADINGDGMDDIVFAFHDVIEVPKKTGIRLATEHNAFVFHYARYGSNSIHYTIQSTQ